MANLIQKKSFFDDEYKTILNNPNCQTGSNYYFLRSEDNVHAPLISSNDIDLAIHDLNTGLGWDGFRANYVECTRPLWAVFD